MPPMRPNHRSRSPGPAIALSATPKVPKKTPRPELAIHAQATTPQKECRTR